jgi:tryptophan-rich sensory protein
MAVICVIAIELLGGASGWLSNSGYGNAWFDALRKPSFVPPGWLFGVVWPILYALLGIAVGMILAEPPSDQRRFALILFFARHDIVLAKIVIFVMAAVAALSARQFLKMRRPAGLLMLPYLAWLVFAATLNSTIESLNPGAGTSLIG